MENDSAHSLMEALGFAEQQPFARMVPSPGQPPGDPSTTLFVAGPELG